MKLDRNLPGATHGKYALIKLREVPYIQNGIIDTTTLVGKAIQTLHDANVLDFGIHPDTDFFVIRLKDKHAWAALEGYAISAMEDDREYAEEIHRLANIALEHPNKQQPT